MLVALLVKNKVSFIDGSLPYPDASDPHHRAWNRSNNVVISWIFNFVSKEIVANVMYSATAMEIWNNLRERFAQKNDPHVFQLCRELMSLHQGSDSVSVSYTKLKTISDELLTYKPIVNCVCGVIQPLLAHSETEHVISFLMGLNDSFSQVRGSLLLMGPIPPINKVFSFVIQEENLREVSTGSGSSDKTSLAFTAQASSQGGTRSSDSTEKAKQSKKDRPICSHCGLPGRTAAKCFKLHGYSPGMKPKSKHQTSAVAGQASGAFQQTPGVQNAVTTLSPEQFNQLIQLLKN